VIATSTILRVAAERREEIRALTNGSRRRAIEAGARGGDQIVLDYELTSRGNEPVWMPDQSAPLGYTLDTVPVYLQWEPTRTTTRALGYVMPPAMASVVPLLQDHDIAVYRFREPATLQAEVYYATSVNREEYFQGHYLKSVEAEKRTESLDVAPGWYWVPTAQSRGNLISYLMEPETDDNLITWGWADHVVEVRPGTVEEAMAQLLGDIDRSQIPAERLAEIEEDIREDLAEGQRVPMMRITTRQSLPVTLVAPFNQYQRNRYFR
jgi:hypothetical protein